jgi:hypothetical protein
MHVVFIHMSIVVVTENWQFLVKEEKLWFWFCTTQLWLGHIVFFSGCMSTQFKFLNPVVFAVMVLAHFFQEPLDSVQKFNLVSCITCIYIMQSPSLEIYRYEVL